MVKIQNKKGVSFSELWKNVDFSKPSSWGIIFSNLAVIFFAIVDKLSAVEVMWIYWIQSVIIGIINFFRILLLRNFSTEGFRSNNKNLPPTKTTKTTTAIFFLLHYGFFHLVYAAFLGAFPFIIGDQEAFSGGYYLLFTALFFLINYGFEFYKEQTTPTDEIPNLGAIMFMPYYRIIPMHLTIILGGFIAASGSFIETDSSFIVILMLMGIKTIVDLGTHSKDVLTGSVKKQSLESIN